MFIKITSRMQVCKGDEIRKRNKDGSYSYFELGPKVAEHHRNSDAFKVFPDGNDYETMTGLGVYVNKALMVREGYEIEMENA